MVDYNPKSWWKLIFMFHKSDTFRQLFSSMCGVGIFTLFLAYIENQILHLQTPKNPLAVHGLIGFVLSMLLVFRTNTAYDRWWEGRRLWGSFTNNSRNLMLKLNSILPNYESKKIFEILISNFILASKQHLRGNASFQNLIEIDIYTHNYYKTAKHLPIQVMKAIYDESNKHLKNGNISQEQMLYINPELLSFMDNLGACERILRTPIPYSYSLFLKKIIFLYILTMPIGFVLEYSYWAAPMVALVFYVFASIELLAEEIENPFGTDTNDLPLDKIYHNISDNLKEIITPSM